MKRKIPSSIARAAAKTALDKIQKDQSKRLMARYRAAFARRHEQDLKDTISRAQKGDPQALFDLIEWDKLFLFASWAKAQILDAQLKLDRIFFKKLSCSIKKLRGFQRKTEHPGLAAFVCDLVQTGLLDPTNPESINTWRKRIVKFVADEKSKARRCNNDRLVLALSEDDDTIENDPAFRKFVKNQASF